MDDQTNNPFANVPGFGKKGGIVGAGGFTHKPLRIVPVLDDNEPPIGIWQDEPTNDAESARYWAERHGEQIGVIRDLQSDLSDARFQRDIYWPLAFCVGVIAGGALGWIW